MGTIFGDGAVGSGSEGAVSAAEQSIRGGGGPPAFKTGGSFKVGGMAGIDRNLVQFRASRGEIVDIHKKGADMGRAAPMVFDLRGQRQGRRGQPRRGARRRRAR
jgi:hypothetical protein